MSKSITRHADHVAAVPERADCKAARGFRAALLAAGFLVMVAPHLAAQVTPRVVCGYQYTLALKADGTVWAWGNNTWGQLGQGNTTALNVHQPVAGMTGVLAVKAGGGSTHCLRSDGSVWAWGYNLTGTLGTGTSFATLWPAPVVGISGAVGIGVGIHHSLVRLGVSGTPRSTGRDNGCQLGHGTCGVNTVSMQPLTANAISDDVTGGVQHTLLLMPDGTVRGCGTNNYGELAGPISIGGTSGVCLTLQGLSNVAAINSTYWTSFALRHDSLVQGFGRNDSGQLGIGNTIHQSVPSYVPLSAVVIAATGFDHSAFLTADGTVHTSGSNAVGQSGIGLALPSVSLPTAVPGLCLNAPGYAFDILPIGTGAIGMSIQCSSVAMAAMTYMNAYAFGPNLAVPGAMNVLGLWLTVPELQANLDLIALGVPLSTGLLGPAGGASASIALAPASIAGLTIRGVDILISPLTGALVGSSGVAIHTF